MRNRTSVAPLVGAWIEILQTEDLDGMFCVAPLVGAWIEISFVPFLQYFSRVAPLVGAWIEIFQLLCSVTEQYRRSSCRSVD